MSDDAATRAKVLAEAATTSASTVAVLAATTAVQAAATTAILAGAGGDDDDDVRTAEAVAATYGEADALRGRVATLEQDVALFKRLLNPPADRRDDVAKALEGRGR